jgi:peptidoglycan/LPS O-acetylase OafA/YrhL
MSPTPGAQHQGRQAPPLPAPLPAHLPALDGVRGIAILWVMLHNLSLMEIGAGSGPLMHLLIDGIDAGWAGVTLFFALSGFLITGILLDSREAPGYYRNFYVRRVLRIFPLYYGVLFVAFVLIPLLVHPVPLHVAEDRPEQIWLWTYLSNWGLPYGIADYTFPHFWSLAVEEQFYLLWPLLVRSRGPRAVLRLAAVLAAASLLVRAAMAVAGAPPEALYAFSVTRMDALALGGAAAAVLRMPAWRAWVAARAGLLLGVAVGLFMAGFLGFHALRRLDPMTQTVGYTLLAVCFSLLVLALAAADATGKQRWWAQGWRIAPLRVLAKYSYGMYIFHKILGDVWGKPWMRSHGDAVLRSLPANLLYFALGVLATLGIAMLSYHLVEKRFLQLKPLFAGRAAVPQVAST